MNERWHSLGRRRPVRVVAALLAVACAGLAVWSWSLSVHSPVEGLFWMLLVVLSGLTGTLAVRQRRLLVEKERALDEAAVHADILWAVARMATLDGDAVVQAAVEALPRLGFPMANIARHDAEQGVLTAVASHGFVDWTPTVIEVGEGLAGGVFVRGETVAIADYHEYERKLEGRQGVRGCIATPIKVDGETFGVLIGASPEVRDPSERDIAIIEAIAAQAGRALANVSRYERELAHVERLQRLDQLKSDFLSNVSHELRTPLTVIKGLGQTLVLHGDRVEPRLRAELLDRMNANAERLGSLITSLLDFSRFEAGQVRIEPEPVDLGVLAQAVVARLGPIADAHELRIAVEPAVVEADAELLQNVVENLVTNAVKHTPSGTLIEVDVTCANGEVRVAVRDEGPGIAPEDLEHITERFYRARHGTASDPTGLGLGLALSSQILAAHGSRLHVESSLGRGATFWFCLPALKDQHEAGPDVSAAPMQRVS